MGGLGAAVALVQLPDTPRLLASLLRRPSDLRSAVLLAGVAAALQYPTLSWRLGCSPGCVSRGPWRPAGPRRAPQPGAP